MQWGLTPFSTGLPLCHVQLKNISLFQTRAEGFSSPWKLFIVAFLIEYLDVSSHLSKN